MPLQVMSPLNNLCDYKKRIILKILKIILIIL